MMTHVNGGTSSGTGPDGDPSGPEQHESGQTPTSGEPAPPFTLSRETRIRVDREGRFWHENDLITHEALWQSLAGWIGVDPATGRYKLENSVNWAFVTVEDAPLVVRALRPDLKVRLTDGQEEDLDLASLRLDDDDVPYCDVRGGTLPARFSRHAAYALLEQATVDDDGDIWIAGRKIPRVPRGEGARRRTA